jgi:hypothetical protein
MCAEVLYWGLGVVLVAASSSFSASIFFISQSQSLSDLTYMLKLHFN